MIYKNTPQLRTWLQDAAFNVIAEYEEFTLSEEDYRRQLSKVQRRPVGEREDAAAFRCLTSEKHTSTARLLVRSRKPRIDSFRWV